MVDRNQLVAEETISRESGVTCGREFQPSKPARDAGRARKSKVNVTDIQYQTTMASSGGRGWVRRRSIPLLQLRA
jgi:hypothetical protein